MVWSPADERFQENLAAARAYYEEHWTLCAPGPRPRWTGRSGSDCPTCAVPKRWKGARSGRLRSARSTRTARTGSVTVPRAHVETVVIDGQKHAV